MEARTDRVGSGHGQGWGHARIGLEALTDRVAGNTGTYGLYEWGSSGFAAAYGISLSRESRDRLYPPLRPIN